MKIRLMISADIKEAYHLWQKAGLNMTKYKREQFEVRNILKINPSSCLVLVYKGKIIGTILGTFNGRRTWLYHLAVHPDYQNKGYGSLLLDKAEKALIKSGATKILIGVLPTNKKALVFYQNRSFSIMDDALVLQKDLWKE